MRTVQWLGVVVVVAVVAGVVTQRVTAARMTPPVAVATVIGPVGTIKEVMEGIVDPSSDVLFDSVSTVTSAAGTVENMPRTDDEWANVRHNALMLAEAANLLTMSGRHAGKPTDVQPVGDPSAPELTPAQVDAKIAEDPAKWLGFARALQGVAIEAIAHADKKSVEGMYDVGDKIDKACENCHLEDRYPNDKKNQG